MDLEFRVILGLLFLFFIGHRGYYSRKFKTSPEQTIDQQANNLASKIAGFLALAGLAAALAYIVVPAWISWSAIPMPAWLRWIGVLAAGLGFGLLQWSHVALGQNWSDTPRITASQHLVTIGPYRWIRHPIYTSFLLIFMSTLLISANWFIGGLWIAITSFDIFNRIQYEEEKMMVRFGETYQEYIKSTGLLLPRL